MLRRLTITVFGTAFLYCVSAVAVFDNKEKPKDSTPGCHPILTIPGSDAEPFFATDCTICITCTVFPNGSSCAVNADCSNDPIGCLTQFRCPTLSCGCTTDGNHIGCDCECTGSGVDCSWTDANGIFREITKNCPDTLP